MGSLGNVPFPKLFDLLCNISPRTMSEEDQKMPMSERINAARLCLDKIIEMASCETESISRDDITAQFDTGLDVLACIARDPFWSSRRDKDPSDSSADVLQTVYDAVKSSRAMAEMLLSETPRTPSVTPTSSTGTPLGSVSFASSGGSQSQGSSQGSCSGADSGLDSGPDSGAVRDLTSALRRPVTADMRLSSVAGMAQAKQLLTEAVVMPIRFRHLFTGARKPWHSVLLYGPPGTGKTKLALALAAEVDAELYAISPADLLSSWFGRTEQNIRDLFGQLRVRGAARCVIVFFDEVDGLCRRRTNEEAESTRRMKTELLTQLQGNSNSNNDQGGGHLFFICATNCPWEIDPAFLRRFQRRIFIGLPDRDSRKEIIRNLASGVASGVASGTELNLPAAEWRNLLDQTAGFSGSDLSDLVKNALYQPVRELTTATHWVPVGGMWTPCSSTAIGAVRQTLQFFPPEMVCARGVTIRDFYDVIEGARPTVCEADLQRYEEFTKQFGQWG